MTSHSSEFTLPEEISQRFTTLAENIGRTHRSLGIVMDEYISDLPHGYHMIAYGLFADLYRQVTGETVSVRQVRAWRQVVTAYSREELRRYEALTDAQLIEAVKLAEIANIEPTEICEWAVANVVTSVPQMQAHWLPVTSDGQDNIDLPAISAVIRTARRFFPADDPRWDELNQLLARLRELLVPE